MGKKPYIELGRINAFWWTIEKNWRLGLNEPWTSRIETQNTYRWARIDSEEQAVNKEIIAQLEYKLDFMQKASKRLSREYDAETWGMSP